MKQLYVKTCEEGDVFLFHMMLSPTSLIREMTSCDLVPEEVNISVLMATALFSDHHCTPMTIDLFSIQNPLTTHSSVFRMVSPLHCKFTIQVFQTPSSFLARRF